MAGHLLGEYDGIQETVWLGDIPVVTLRPHSGGGVDIHYAVRMVKIGTGY
ncbi:MAG TPA: hypothetical protein VMT29_15780 [Steroidobacteraceae bacterium]|nr:hypothetical protein [Steroidobacteraceae bacterium]